MMIQIGQNMTIPISGTGSLQEVQGTVKKVFEYDTETENGILAEVNIPGFENRATYYFPEQKDYSGITNNSGMPEEYMSKRPDDFRFDLYDTDLSLQKRIINDFIVNFDSWRMQGRGLFIYSQTKGSGKTLLACIIANEIVKRHQATCKFLTITDYIDKYKSRSSDLERIKNTDLLIVDDFGVQDEKQEWIAEIIYGLIDRRYRSMTSTIFTSNCDYKINGKDAICSHERTASRVHGMSHPIKLPETSIRELLSNRSFKYYLNDLNQRAVDAVFSHRSSMRASEMARVRMRTDAAGTGERPLPMQDVPKSYQDACNLFVYLAQQALSKDFPFIEKLQSVYIYSITEEARIGCDGQCQLSDGVYRIALSETIVDVQNSGDFEYGIMVLLHEMAHIQYEDHNRQFYELLHRMIRKFDVTHNTDILTNCGEDIPYYNADQIDLDGEGPLRHIWTDMHFRCENPKSEYWKDYGGRGIKVCSEWSGEDGYKRFREWAKVNGYRHGLSIDRTNNNENYSPGNCRWSTPKQQANNRRRRQDKN